MRVIFESQGIIVSAEFNDSRTAKEIFDNLPVQSNVSLWGEEVYFDIGFKASAEGATMEVEKGEVAYWPQGKGLCIFFGPTPASVTEKPVPASPVVIVGKVVSDLKDLKNIELGAPISVSAE
ncbi:MAG: hypothetical protein GF375_04195 [Candidatus Omnitrophica bacterium]|nr:hypothetical protein [Candidatus Omnitrophota bacterium]